VSALALLEGIGPPPMPPEIAPDRSRRWLEALARPNVRESRRLASVAEAVERLRATHGGSVPSAVLERVATESTMPHPSGEGRIWRFDPLHQTTSPGRFDADAFEQYAARIRAPVLIVDGGENGMRLPGTDHRAGAYRNVARARIDGAGHMMHWTRPDETADAVIAFLEGVARRLAG
jgi:pimeloyl-ACP methyl ester carboxylesterase